MSKDAPLASKLKEGRVARGLSISELADIIGISRQSVSKYESGLSIPSADVFYKIMQTLQLPLAFFLVADKYEINNDGMMYFRSLKSADRKSLDMSEIRTLWMKKIYRELTRYIKFPSTNLPDISNEYLKDEYKIEDIEKITSMLREFWKLGNGPIDNLTYTLEKNGIIVTRIGIESTKIDAFSKWIDEDRLICFLGTNKNCAVRSRFDLAHELGHAVLHKCLDQMDLYDPKKLKRIEKEANMFASAFLLPHSSFGSEIMSTSLQHFVLLKERWKVSIQAMIYRCHELGYLSDDQTLYLRKKIVKSGIRENEPLDDKIEIERPSAIRQSVELLLNNKLIDKKSLIDIVNIPVEELEELLTLAEGTLKDNAKILNIDFRNNIK